MARGFGVSRQRRATGSSSVLARRPLQGSAQRASPLRFVTARSRGHPSDRRRGARWQSRGARRSVRQLETQHSGGHLRSSQLQAGSRRPILAGMYRLGIGAIRGRFLGSTTPSRLALAMATEATVVAISVAVVEVTGVVAVAVSAVAAGAVEVAKSHLEFGIEALFASGISGVAPHGAYRNGWREICQTARDVE